MTFFPSVRNSWQGEERRKRRRRGGGREGKKEGREGEGKGKDEGREGGIEIGRMERRGKEWRGERGYQRSTVGRSDTINLERGRRKEGGGKAGRGKKGRKEEGKERRREGTKEGRKEGGKKGRREGGEIEGEGKSARNLLCLGPCTAVECCHGQDRT